MESTLHYDLTMIAPTICRLAGLDMPPDMEGKQILDKVIAAAGEVLCGNRIDKILIYAPDALGKVYFDRFPQVAEKLEKLTSIAVRLQSVMPTKTPVCFASFFSGLYPAEHGITKYEKPVLKVRTLFDIFAGAGRKAAIVAVENSSIDLIFRGRNISYYSEKYDSEVSSRVIKLLKLDLYDLIVVYNQEYDDAIHRTTPYSRLALRAAGRHHRTFRMLDRIVNRCWKDHDRLLLFAPDHGVHLNTETGRGDHGLDIPADMELIHFWKFGKGRRNWI